MKIHSDHQPATKLSRTRLSGWAAFLLFVMVVPFLRASDLPPPYTLNLPFQANEATPIWLDHPETPLSAFATLNLPITPPDPTASLLVTVFFQEKEGGFLRISWQGADNAQVLSDNFYEGIAMNNQRSLLISPDVLQSQSNGKLHFQSGDSAIGIQRIRLEWLENRTGLVSPLMQDLLVTPAMGLTQFGQSLDGQPKPTDEAVWHDQVVTVPLTELPERIEQGVEFNVQLESIPSSARLAFKEAGLPWGQHIVVWINQKKAGTITPAVPNLLDDGFLALPNTPNGYIGWRQGSFYVPVALLKAGANAVQFSTEADAPPADGTTANASTGPVTPLAIKSVFFQLNYPPASTQAPVAPSVPPSNSPEPAPASATPSTDSTDSSSSPPTPSSSPVTPTPAETPTP